MSQAIVDPAELRRFAHQLKQFNADLQTNLGALHGRLLGLGDTWRDQEHEKFTQEFEQALHVIEHFLEVADQHGLVLKLPEPVARLDGFGDKSLVFSLHYWFDLGKTSCDALASDIRLMIEKSFTEAGLVMSRPQTDVRLESGIPLRVELSRPSNTTP